MPRSESANRRRCLRFSDRPFDEKPSPEDSQHFGVEMFGNPTLGIGGQESSESTASPGITDYLNSSRRIYDDSCHASASTRNSRSAAAASRLSSSGSGPARSSSRKAWKAAGEQSSSGFVTTTDGPGGRSLGRFAMPPSYRPLLPLRSLTIRLAVDYGLPAPTAVKTTVVSIGDARVLAGTHY